jgi:GT2 family glycosyltransferase
VVVADNSGTYDGPGRVVATGANLGFGGGCNAAVAALAADTDIAILHNPDVDAEPAVLRALAARLSAQPSGGLLAPAVREEGGRRGGGFHWPRLRRELALAVLEATGVQHRRRRRERGRAGPVAHVAPPVATFGSGALLAVDVAAFRAVGGFDERFFLYLEDADLWRRVAEAGFAVGFAPDLEVRHVSGTGSPLGTLDRAALRWVGVELFTAVHGRRGAWVLHRIAHLLPAVVAAGRGCGTARLVLGRWLRLRPPTDVAASVSPARRASAGR